MHRLRGYGIAALALALCACAGPTTRRVEVDEALVASEARKQRRIALRSLMEDQHRLDDVSYRIMTGATAFCGEALRPTLGAHFASLSSFPESFRETAKEIYNMQELPQVVHVTPGSPASGLLLAGDRLAKIRDAAVPPGEEAMKNAAVLWKEQVRSGEEVAFTFERDGKMMEIAIAPLAACDYPVLAVSGGEVNAFADGSRIGITRGMLRFARDDTELSIVISHELAHNVMKHVSAQQRNVMLGSILDILTGVLIGVNTGGTFGRVAVQAYSQEFEAEADYVGLYIMAGAGLDIGDSPYFWRRMAAEHPGSIKKNHGATHPATPERFLALEKTVEEIRRKREAGADLVPEYKK